MAMTYLTADLPGIGGTIKERPEDFLVEEQPLYEPAGAGEHLYLCIEKRGITTFDVVRHLSRSFHVNRRDVGYAGLKDKQAVTRQHFSIWLPGASQDVVDEGLRAAADGPVTILWAQRHGNKLRRGHLAANRFVIRVRQVDPMAVVHAHRVLAVLERRGAPNYVGEQRFGYRGDNAVLGRLLLQGRWQEFLDCLLGQPRPGETQETQLLRQLYDQQDYAGALAHTTPGLRQERQALEAMARGRSPEQAVMRIDEQQREFFVSAAQSAVFNDVLEQRLKAGCFDRLVAGDLAWKHDNRSVFAVDEATAALENSAEGRVSALAVSPSGPMWGVDMTRATGEVGRWELDALMRHGLAEDDLAGGRQGRATGVRRPLRVPVRQAQVSGGVDEHGSFVRLAFDLERGSFATMVLREIMKQTAIDVSDTDEE
jgi:tRNA pseudouridine13 synthase